MRIGTFIAAIAALMFSITGAFAGGDHKVVFQINDNDPALMNLVLNNVANVRSYYADKGEDLTVEVVAYGPGLHMLMSDSPVKDRISAMSLENEKMQFSACQNTMDGMKKKTGKDVSLVSEAKVVPAGVVRIMELQEEGYKYVKP